MNMLYNRLIFLAEELDTPFSPKRIAELNVLLAGTSIAEVKPEHISLLDDLVSIISNTGNLLTEHAPAVFKLQDDLRSRT